MHILLVVATIFFASTHSTLVNYAGQVYCRLSTAADEGSLVLPVKNVDQAEEGANLVGTRGQKCQGRRGQQRGP
jgi:hypothetical protein